MYTYIVIKKESWQFPLYQLYIRNALAVKQLIIYLQFECDLVVPSVVES